MQQQTITTLTGKILYQTHAETKAEALEKAISDKVKLHAADLSHLDLRNTTLDEADLYECDFSNSNLCGANLSDSIVKSCNFDNTNLIDTCLAYSDLTGCSFKNTDFGATNITQSILENCTFEGLSSLTLPFIKCKTIKNNHYIHTDQECYLMNKAPIVIYGLHNIPLIIFPNTVLCGTHKENIKFNCD